MSIFFVVCCSISSWQKNIVKSISYKNQDLLKGELRAIYTKYASQFLRSIKSLELSRNVTRALERIRKHTDQGARDMISYLERILYKSDSEDAPALENNKSDFGLLTGLLIFGFILLCSAFYFLYYRKRKRRKREKTRTRRSKKTSRQ